MFKNKKYSKLVLSLSLAGLMLMTSGHAAESPTGIIGKNEWLFYKYELSDVKDKESTGISLDLIQRFNKVVSVAGVNLAVVMVPLKMRLYSEHLPDEVRLNDYMAGNYDRMIKVLRSGGVNAIDLNTPFMASSKRASENPIYFRLDSHWSPTGSMLASEVVKAELLANPALKSALDQTPEEGFKVVYGTRKRPSKVRDLVNVLPSNSLTFAPEQVMPVNVSRLQPPKEDLLGNGVIPGLTLLGSSYSHSWTGFSDGLRYQLQRDLLSISVGADQGSWVGLETYLRDDAFQTKPPKILIWEMPERDLLAPPGYKFRDARYKIDDMEWLLRVSAWVQPSCKASSVTAKLGSAGLASNPAQVKGANVSTGPTTDNDFVELNFDKPLERLDYLAGRTITAGSKTVTLEASGPGVTTRRFAVNVAGDDLAHALKTPLPSNGGGFTKVKIFPGITTAFALQNVQVCRQPEGLLPQ